MMKPVIVLLVLLVGVAVAADWTTFRSSALGFSLQYPSGWRVTSTADTGIATVQFEALRGDSSVAQFSVSVAPAQSLERWVNARRKAEVLIDGTSRVERVRDARLAGRASKQITLFAFDRYVREEAVVVGQRLYVLSFDEDNPNDQQFKAHRATYLRMRSSLEFR